MSDSTTTRSRNIVNQENQESGILDGSSVEKQKPDSDSATTFNMTWWYEDRSSVLLLLFLYLLQGIPLGLAGSIPMLLAGKNVDYHQQAIFSFVFWPFSIKLLWAPIVDGAYFQRFGRRKTWLVPTQYCIAVIMLILSHRLDFLLQPENLNIIHLTAAFFILNFCAATQDIAVDGWALTMLSKKNVGLASTCNTVGQTAGYFLGYVVFLALESAEFCNKYLRFTPVEDQGMVTLAGFMYFWSIVFFITTTLVMLLKNETKVKQDDKDEGNTASKGVFSTYKLLWKILCLPNIIQYVIILLTCKIGFAFEAVVGLKLIEAGMHKESLALFAVPLTPLQIVLPLFIAKYTTGPKPMDIFLKAIKFRLMFTVWFSLIVYFTPMFKQEDGDFPAYYFILILITYCFHQVALYSMFVAGMSFNAKISDPHIGGTYMTLLNTFTNLGGNWPSTLALWYVDDLTTTSCVGGDSGLQFCTKETSKECALKGGTCVTAVDGFYIEAVICLIAGVLWLVWRSKTLRELQNLDSEKWKCPR